MGQNPNAEVLKHIFGLGPVAEAFDKKAKERITPLNQRGLGRWSAITPFRIVAHSNFLPSVTTMSQPTKLASCLVAVLDCLNACSIKASPIRIMGTDSACPIVSPQSPKWIA